MHIFVCIRKRIFAGGARAKHYLLLPASSTSSVDQSLPGLLFARFISKALQCLMPYLHQPNSLYVRTVEDTLDTSLPRAYTPELYKEKCSAVFEHVYESYPERDLGVYAGSN